MGRLIYFEDHHPDTVGRNRARQQSASPQELKSQEPQCGQQRRLGPGESLIPLQLALDEYNIERCFSLLARFGRCPVYPRANSADVGKVLFLVRIRDALAMNQYLLEQLEEDSQAQAHRIDHIQMLENSEESLLSKAWDRIGLETAVQFPPSQDADSLTSH